MEFGNENVRVRMEVDRISSLPDEIIHHILSFNDTKYAVQTCVLSSRWKLIWTTLPYLKLGTEEFRILPKFYKFVNRLLLLRNHQTEVSSLDLYIRGPLTTNHKFVQKVAGYVASHNVKKVKIFAYDLKVKEDLEFPLCFFSSQSLKHLSVETYCHRDRIFPLPQLPWDSPALTTVELNDVWLCADSTVCLDLFSKCVNLMNLTLKDCRSHGLKLMKILCPRLVHLSISKCWHSEYEILAPNLSSFYYDGCEPLVLSTGGLNSLENVNLHMGITSSISNERTQQKAHEFMNMLGKLCSAKSVILYGPVVEFLSKVLDLPENPPSPFYNLKCLRIEGLERPKKLAKSDLTNQVINYFLNSSPTATVSKEYRKMATTLISSQVAAAESSRGKGTVGYLDEPPMPPSFVDFAVGDQFCRVDLDMRHVYRDLRLPLGTTSVSAKAYNKLARAFTGAIAMVRQLGKSAEYWKGKCHSQGAVDVSHSTSPFYKQADDDGSPHFRYVDEMDPFYQQAVDSEASDEEQQHGEQHGVDSDE